MPNLSGDLVDDDDATWTSCSPKSPLIRLPVEAETNGRHFPDDIFKCIFLNENVWISYKISLKFDPKVRINNIQALVQIMAWRRPGDKPLSEPMMIRLLTHICVTRPQWVNSLCGPISRNIKVSVIGPLWGEFTGEFPAQRASNTVKASMLWRHHGNYLSIPHSQLNHISKMGPCSTQRPSRLCIMCFIETFIFLSSIYFRNILQMCNWYVLK